MPSPVLATLGFIVILASLSCQGEMIKARSGVVATDETICSKVGRDVLVSGGHAVDAAVAAAFCLGVVNPPFSGLGGGGFMLVRQASGEAKVFDMKEMAPKRAHRDMFKTTDHTRQGPRSIAIPGEIAGLYLAWKEFGKLPWKRLVSPAETLARNGFNISKFLYELLTYEKTTLRTNKALCEVFAPNGRLVQEGQTLRQVNLANTLLQISKNGMAAFYNGSIGRNMTRDILEAGGVLTMEDLQSYRVKIREPITAHVMGLKILAAPPPASGGAMMILILKILNQYGLPKGASGALGLHRTIEALKYALAMRMELGDPDFVDTKKTITSMLSTSYAAKLKKSINDNRTFDSPHYGSKWEQIHDHGTTHVCVVDGKRNVGKKLKAVIGAAGGILIPDALNPNLLLYENYSSLGYQYRAPLRTIEFVKSRRHRVASRSIWDTVCQFVVQELDGPNSGMLYAVSDTRKGGTPAGY
ncbi:gamma-glutamyltranspeptidase 1 [Phtheirospermum japonicum]|uniref:Gamma-glutamyltranspeptidase 1 n=1 Tax=Phtheirospermum japonicum TaxID=374723 RepID=A0A830BS40_9LAMI|nr:gamma-glutamyltranspeptidase 1 [Phtheirospermum japonicum]